MRYEPNDAEFNRITHRVYEYINEMKDYEILYSTRFFGPMLFYFAWYKKIERIIAYMLDNSQVSECSEVISLYYIIHEIKRETVHASKFELIKVIRINKTNVCLKREFKILNLNFFSLKDFILKELDNNENCQEALEKLIESNKKSQQKFAAN